MAKLLSSLKEMPCKIGRMMTYFGEGFTCPVIVMIVWDGTEVVYRCVPRTPGPCSCSMLTRNQRKDGANLAA